MALVIAKKNKENPNESAKKIVDKFIKENAFVKEISIVAPGFINFYLVDEYYANIVQKIITEGADYGKAKSDLHYNLEFVSANPTGFLHVAHARGAALGDSLGNIFNHVGIKVTREYVINDAGSQIGMLAYASFVRYQQLFGKEIELPEESYHGQDIV
jgi:arginyl-tRNA synthetase